MVCFMSGLSEYIRICNQLVVVVYVNFYICSAVYAVLYLSLGILAMALLIRGTYSAMNDYYYDNG